MPGSGLQMGLARHLTRKGTCEAITDISGAGHHLTKGKTHGSMAKQYGSFNGAGQTSDQKYVVRSMSRQWNPCFNGAGQTSDQKDNRRRKTRVRRDRASMGLARHLTRKIISWPRARSARHAASMGLARLLTRKTGVAIGIGVLIAASMGLARHLTRKLPTSIYSSRPSPQLQWGWPDI